jgi:signal transduction histidine kinase
MALFNPRDLMEELLGRLKPLIDQKNLEADIALNFDASIRGDKEAIISAFTNILNNAVKFAPESGRIAVEMRPDNEDLALTVTNTFDPLPEEDLTHIFEPFYRTEGNKVKGTGLGLAITKKIIEKHGGTIEAKNSEEGLSIMIRLPVASSSHS